MYSSIGSQEFFVGTHPHKFYDEDLAPNGARRLEANERLRCIPANGIIFHRPPDKKPKRDALGNRTYLVGVLHPVTQKTVVFGNEFATICLRLR